MFTINKALIPIKAHYLFFTAAMGPVLPQVNVFGKQLGISPDVMGLITSVLPIMCILAKPTVGFIADYFSSSRKFIFMMILLIMSLCYAGFYFVQQPNEHLIDSQAKLNISMTIVEVLPCNEEFTSHQSLCTSTRQMECITENKTFGLYVKRNSGSSNEEVQYSICIPQENNETDIKNGFSSNLSCTVDTQKVPDCLYNTFTFWLFLVLMCLGKIGFNVSMCISDAVCFDMLGESQEMKYGKQRVFSPIGFGISALIAGVAVNLSTENTVKNFTPALIIMLVFSGIDLLIVRNLKLPRLSTDSILHDVSKLLRRKEILTFLIFVTIAGVLDSFIFNYKFWHLEEVAAKTGYMKSIKLIEGCVVAAECLGGDVLFYIISGKILKRIGYVHCLSFCLFTYALRLGLISLINNPWWLVITEFFMEGCTYALCYTCIVAYASAIAPPGTSATVQGLVAGLDDGLGCVIGSLIGGQLYRYLGGSSSFQIFSLGAILSCVAHALLRPAPKNRLGTPHDEYEPPADAVSAARFLNQNI